MVGRKAMKTFEFFVDLPRFDKAKCVDVEDKDLFFPINKKAEEEILPQLKAICASCIHNKECLAYALEKQIPFGIWGGSSPSERDAVIGADNKIYAFKGIALMIVNLHKKGIIANEIAVQLNTSPGYVRKVLKRWAATEQGATPLHQQTKDLSEGLR